MHADACAVPWEERGARFQCHRGLPLQHLPLPDGLLIPR